jgi:cytochrome P450
VAGRATVFDFLPAPFLALKFNYLRTRHHWKVFHEIVETEVKAALDGQPSSNFVRNLIDARDKNDNRSLSFLQIRDNLLAFVVAGHETTALTLSWALLMLAHDQESQEKAREEVNETLAGSLDDIGDKLGRLPFCRQILDEAMRLYPPAPAISRRAEADDELVGVKIRKGESILIPISVIHRHQNYWDNPHAFWPDRFSGGHKFDRFLFIPFGAGPRICVGASMAYMSMEVILAALLAKFRFFPTDAMPQPVLLLTLRPRGGIPLKVERIR